MAQQTVTLQPGETKTVSFEAIPHEARTYQVSVNGQSGSFKAVAVTVDFHGIVTDAETKQPLSGVTVEIWSGKFLGDVTTNTSGYYIIGNIEVPGTYTFKYKKDGYRDYVTDPIYMDRPDGYGLNVSLVPLVPTLLTLYCTPKTATTHWNVYDHRLGTWLSRGELAKRIGEAYVFVPADLNYLVLTFLESVNIFQNEYKYGPFVLPISGLGEYAWNGQTEKLNGQAGICLPKSSNRCQVTGTITSIQEIVGGWQINLTVEKAENISGYVNAGQYFIGRNIRIKTGENLSLMKVGNQIIGILEMRLLSLGEYGYEFEWWASTIKFATGWPSEYFNFSGSIWRVADWYYTDWYGFIQGPYNSFYARVYSNAGLSTFAIGVYAQLEIFTRSYRYVVSNGQTIRNKDEDWAGWQLQLWAHPNPGEGFNPATAAQKGWVRVA